MRKSWVYPVIVAVLIGGVSAPEAHASATYREDVLYGTLILRVKGCHTIAVEFDKNVVGAVERNLGYRATRNGKTSSSWFGWRKQTAKNEVEVQGGKFTGSVSAKVEVRFIGGGPPPQGRVRSDHGVRGEVAAHGAVT